LEPSRNRVVVPARQATQPGGIGSLETILGLLKSLKIRALRFMTTVSDFLHIAALLLDMFKSPKWVHTEESQISVFLIGQCKPHKEVSSPMRTTVFFKF
jgi:hypothetical protein